MWRSGEDHDEQARWMDSFVSMLAELREIRREIQGRYRGDQARDLGEI